jgi:hypothetical protein
VAGAGVACEGAFVWRGGEREGVRSGRVEGVRRGMVRGQGSGVRVCRGGVDQWGWHRGATGVLWVRSRGEVRGWHG